MKKRSRLEIVSDILLFVEKNGMTRPTNILHRANLSVPLLNKYLEALEKDGLLNRNVRGKKTFYSLTEKSTKFLRLLKKINVMTQTIEVYSDRRKKSPWHAARQNYYK